MSDLPLSEQIVVRLPLDLLRELQMFAKANERTVSQEIRFVLRLHYAQGVARD